MRFEPPNTCLVAYIGNLDGDDVFNMNAAINRIARGKESIFLLVDLSRTDVVSDSARRNGVHGLRTFNPQGTAVFGADYHLRVIATLITKAASLIDVRIKGPVNFFTSEAEARAWLLELRKTGGARRIHV